MTAVGTMAEIIAGAADLARRRAISGRRAFRREATRAVHTKQFEDTEAELAERLTRLFRRQQGAFNAGLRRLVAERSSGSQVKDAFADAAAAIVAQIYNPQDWWDDLIEASLPPLARGMGQAAVAEFLTYGVDPRKSTGYEVGIGGRAVDVKRTTATEWLEGGDDDLPDGILTEWPEWLIDEILTQLRVTFEQPYWRRILETSGKDMERILEQGLAEGHSIRDIARTINQRWPENYPFHRGRLIAITESANSLNAGRDASFRQLKEELGEAGQFVGKEWLSVLGNTTRDAHANLDGELADAEGMWDLNGVRIPWPGHISLPASDRCNCYCTISTVFGAGAPEDEIAERLGEG